MRNLLSSILIVIGALFLTISIYQFYQYNIGTRNALDEAEKLMSEVELEESRQHESEKTPASNLRSQFSPQANDVIGILHIPKIGAELPIIEGTDEEMLQRGVGHYTSTAFPGDNEQILLSGHRDTVFKRLGELEVGDRFIVECPMPNLSMS